MHIDILQESMDMSRRWVRRVAWMTVVALWLQVAVPVQAIPTGGRFPWEGFLRWMRASVAWGAPPAAPDPVTPQQGRGGPVDRGSEVSASATRADGGVGRPRGTGAGELPAYVAPAPPIRISVAPPVDTTQSYSVSAWVKLDDLDADQYAIVMPGAIGASTFKLRYYKVANTWHLTGAGTNAGQTSWWSLASPAGLPAPGVWTHLVFTAQVAQSGNSTVTLFVNGAPRASTSTPVPFNNPATFVRVGSEYGVCWLDGTIAEVAIFPAALTAAEVAAIHQARGDSSGSLVKTAVVGDPGGGTPLSTSTT